MRNQFQRGTFRCCVCVCVRVCFWWLHQEELQRSLFFVSKVVVGSGRGRLNPLGFLVDEDVRWRCGMPLLPLPVVACLNCFLLEGETRAHAFHSSFLSVTQAKSSLLFSKLLRSCTASLHPSSTHKSVTTMSSRRERVLTSSTQKKYTISPASSRTLLSRDELRSIDRYVANATIGPSGSGQAVVRVPDRIPELPFERVHPRHDAVLGLRVCPIRAQEPALDVPLRFEAPEVYHLPLIEDPPARISLARRVGALIKGTESVSVSWAQGSAHTTSVFSADGSGSSTLKDAEARAQSAIRSGSKMQAALLFTSLAALQYNCGNMEAAAAAFNKALLLFESTGSATGVAFCHNFCGLCYFRLGEFKMALVHYKKQETLGEGYSRCVAQINMGVNYAALGELQFASQALEDALANAREVGEPMLETISLGNLGIVALRIGNMRAAQGHLEQCLEQCSLVGDKSGAAVCLLLLGHVYFRIHDYTHAAFYYEHAYRVGGEAGLPDIVAAARVNYGVSRGSAALRETVLAEATAMGKANDVATVIEVLPR